MKTNEIHVPIYREEKIKVEVVAVGGFSVLDGVLFNVPGPRETVRQAWETFAIVCDMLERTR